MKEYGLIVNEPSTFQGEGRGANGPLPTVVGTYADKNNKVWVGGKKTETETSTETVRRRGRREMEVRGKVRGELLLMSPKVHLLGPRIV